MHRMRVLECDDLHVLAEIDITCYFVTSKFIFQRGNSWEVGSLQAVTVWNGDAVRITGALS